MTKNTSCIAGVIIWIGRKYCNVLVSNISGRIYKKFRIQPGLKFKRKETINKLAFITKQGYITFDTGR